MSFLTTKQNELALNIILYISKTKWQYLLFQPVVVLYYSGHHNIRTFHIKRDVSSSLILERGIKSVYDVQLNNWLLPL